MAEKLSKEEVLAKICKIVKSQGLGEERSEFGLEEHFVEDLKADSLDSAELVMEMEDEFELTIPDEEAAKMTTVGAAVDYVYLHQGEPAPAPATKSE